ncbi:MAG: FliA/WhiG family RNA polymerase sigma factor [Thermoguttaceae bacterium]
MTSPTVHCERQTTLPICAAQNPAPTSVPDEATMQLWQEYTRNPCDALRNRLMERYMPLVRNRAERIWARLPDGVELDDLISAGTFGLMDAIGSFDLNRGVKFETFCQPRVQGAILDELRAMDWVPRMVRNRSSKLNEARHTLESQLGRKPDEHEIAKHMGLSLDELKQVVHDSHNVNMTSLDKQWGDGDGGRELREKDIVPDHKSEDPTARLYKIDLIRSFTRGLSKTERLIVILYYYEEMTMKEIGATLDLSESRVSQMHTAIVERIRRLQVDADAA